MAGELARGRLLNGDAVLLQYNPSNNSLNISLQHELYFTTDATNITLNESAAGIWSVIGIAGLICLIGLVGIVGNSMVIFIVLTDRKMRYTVTNLFITNLALSDLMIMVGGVPDIAQFAVNKGWLLGEAACKLERYILVVSLYSSVITLVTVCVERYIAIVYPIRAHMLCSRKKMIVVISLIWPIVSVLGLPVILYNKLETSGPAQFCKLQFPGNHIRNFMMFRYTEAIIFYFIPMLVQVVCYLIIGRHLFAGTEQLHRKQLIVTQDGIQRERSSEAIKARKGVIKMLIASVIIYFVSYSPHQVLLLYNTFSPVPFAQNWVFVVFVNAMAYINSAANPILYCIFSQKFRAKFNTIFSKLICRKERSRRATGANVTSDTAIMMASFKRPVGDLQLRKTIQVVTTKSPQRSNKDFV